MKDLYYLSIIKFCFCHELKRKYTVINSLMDQLPLVKGVNMDKIYEKQGIGSQYTSKERKKEIIKIANNIFSKIVKDSPPTPERTTNEISCKSRPSNKKRKVKRMQKVSPTK